MQENWFLKNIFLIRDSFGLHFKNRNKLNVFLDVFVLVFFAGAFFSIPACSFTPGLNLITWVFTGGFLLGMFFDCLLFYGFKIDIISVGLILFCLSCIISSALNGFHKFAITPIALAICTMFIYIFIKQNPQSKKYLLLGALIGDIIFLMDFIFKYRVELFSFNFERLGGLFGDENDIALFMLFGFSLSTYFVLFKGKTLIKIILGLIALAFLFCAFSSGSKICIVLTAVIIMALIFMLFGKKRWWLSLIVSIGIITLGFLIIWFVPGFATIKSRFISFLNEIFNLNIPGGSSYDRSTTARFFMFLDGLDLWLRKPFFGWGINGFSVYGGFNNGWSHNNISETLCNFGIFGSLCFHLGFVYSFIGYKRQKQRNLNLYLLIIIFFLVSMIEVALNSQKLYAFAIPIAFGSLCLNTPIISIRNINVHFKRA